MKPLCSMPESLFSNSQLDIGEDCTRFPTTILQSFSLPFSKSEKEQCVLTFGCNNPELKKKLQSVYAVLANSLFMEKRMKKRQMPALESSTALSCGLYQSRNAIKVKFLPIICAHRKSGLSFSKLSLQISCSEASNLFGGASQTLGKSVPCFSCSQLFSGHLSIPKSSVLC